MNDPFGPAYVRNVLRLAPIGRLEKQVYPLLGVGIVAGGAARAIIHGDAPEPGDIDVFIRNGVDRTTVFWAMYGLGYSLALDKYNTLTWEHPEYDLSVQTISVDNRVGAQKFLWTDAESVISTFTWTTEMFAIERVAKPPVAVYTMEALADTTAGVLVLNHIIDPIRVAYRAVKYGRKGYTIGPDVLVEIFKHYQSGGEAQQEAWHEANLLNAYQLAARQSTPQ
jgi:hypothetical protein